MRRRSATLEATSVEEYVEKSKVFSYDKTPQKMKRASSMKKVSVLESKSNLFQDQMYSIKESDERSEESPCKITKQKAQSKPVEMVNERGSIANLLARLQSIQAERDENNPGKNL
jgi:hypothetical protein